MRASPLLVELVEQARPAQTTSQIARPATQTTLPLKTGVQGPLLLKSAFTFVGSAAWRNLPRGTRSTPTRRCRPSCKWWTISTWSARALSDRTRCEKMKIRRAGGAATISIKAKGVVASSERSGSVLTVRRRWLGGVGGGLIKIWVSQSSIATRNSKMRRRQSAPNCGFD